MSSFRNLSNRDSHSSFKTPTKHNNVFLSNKTCPTFQILPTDFPELSETCKPTNTSLCFTEAIKKEVVTNDNSSFIPPGTVQITYNKGKFIYQYGESTLTTDILESENPNIIMNNIIHQLQLNRNKHIKQFNKLHGNNAFEDLYVLPPIYGPEYDEYSESESEDVLSNNLDFI